MRNQYKILAEQYNQVQDEATRKNLVGMQNYINSSEQVKMKYLDASEAFWNASEALTNAAQDANVIALFKKLEHMVSHSGGDAEVVLQGTDLDFYRTCMANWQENLSDNFEDGVYSPTDAD